MHTKTTPPTYDSLAHAFAVEQAQRRRAEHSAPASSDPCVLWEAAHAAHVATGMRRSDAIAQVMREQPALSAVYTQAMDRVVVEPE